MAILLSLAAAGAWGASDFLGGLAGRRSEGGATMAVSLQAQVIAALLIAVVSLLVGGSATATDLGWGAAAGVGTGLAVISLYQGLSVGRMGVVAPITGAVGASVPVVVGTLAGERPTALAWLGVVGALVAIVLVSRDPSAEDGAPTRHGVPRGVWHGVGAGLGFAVAFVTLDLTGSTSGLWPTVATKLASAIVILLLALGTRSRLRATDGTRWMPLVIGVADLVAYPAYLVASRTGLLGLVAVLASLYPVVTVGLARVVLDEQLARHQIAGVALAVGAVAMIAAA